MERLLSLLVLLLHLCYATHANVGKTNNIHGFHGGVENGDLQKYAMPFKYENGCVMKPFTVRILSDVNELLLHCTSKDDDLGDVTRNAGGEFDINFCLNIWRTTHWVCDFSWESKHRNVDVFKTHDRHDPSYCFSSDHGARGDCYWLVKEDGFYNALVNNPGPNDWIKVYDWE